MKTRVSLPEVMRKKLFTKLGMAFLSSTLVLGNIGSVFASETTVIESEVDAESAVEYSVETEKEVTQWIDLNQLARYGTNSVIVEPGGRVAFSPVLNARAGQKLAVTIGLLTENITYRFGHMHGNTDTYCIANTSGGHIFTIDEDGEYIVFVDNCSETRFLRFGVVFNLVTE